MKKNKIKTIAVCAAAILSVSTLSGCNLFGGQTFNALGQYDFTQMELVQLQEPEAGKQMATIETDYGTIKAVLYPEYAPNTVANFVARANDGYFDNQPIYCIYEDYYFLSGGHIETNDAGEETGYIGATEDGKAIAAECSVNLWPFKGSFMSYNETGGYGDSRFFVTNTKPLMQSEIDQLKSFVDDDGNQRLPQELIDAFVLKGSLPQIAGGYTIFAQTISGFDVIEEIVKQDKDSETYRPLEEIMIKKVTIGEYDPAIDEYEFPDIPEDQRIAPETESETTETTVSAS